MNIIKEAKVSEDFEGERLSDFCEAVFWEEIPSRKGLKKAIKRGEILIDNNAGETGTRLKIGQKIALFASIPAIKKVFPLKCEVVYQDQFLAVINKPAGFPTSGNRFKTIANSLPFNLCVSQEKDALTFPHPAHRLDSSTSGLLIVAKTQNAQIALGKMFAEKKIGKKYRAIVIGNLAKNGIVETPINGQEAITFWETLKTVRSLRSGFLSLVELSLLTGRTHQLRIHMAEIGNQILGDSLYGNPNLRFKGKGLFLTSVELQFKHPISNLPLLFRISEPNKFALQLEKEELRWKKFNL